MSFPIPVNMTVSGDEPIQMTVQGDVAISCSLDIRVVPRTYDEYAGPYSVTPSEEVQTLETDGKLMAGDVSVEAIPSNYVGSAVPRRTSKNVHLLIINNVPTIVVQRGYYETAKEKDITTGTATTPATSITANPTISVDSSGLVTASVSASQSVTPTVNEGYVMSGTAGTVSVQGNKTIQLPTLGATTYTPAKGTVQTIPLGNFLTGDQTISAIPDSWYDMGGALAWLGAGAELVTTFTLADVKLSATNFDTWTPSTTAADILATRNAGTFTATDAPNWNYFIVWETKIPIVYASAGTNKAKPLFLASIIINAIFRRPSSYDNLKASNYNNTVNATAYTGNFLRYYGTTTNTMTYTYAASYGLYGAATAATFSSATANSPTVTAKTPKIQARCSTTYMSTANAGYIDKDKTIISQKGYVYKVKRSTFLQGCYEREIALVNEVDA